MDTTNQQTSSISPTIRGTEYWASREFLSQRTRDALRHAAIVLVPHENYREQVAAVFPNGTTELFRILKERSPEGMKVEIAVEESEYREIALHYDVVRLPTILIDWVVAPILAAWLVEYLMRKLGSRFEKAEVEASLIVEQECTDGRKAFQLDYKGPASAFEKTIKGDLAKMVSRSESAKAQEEDGNQ